MPAKLKSFFKRARTAVKRAIQDSPEKLRLRYSRKPEYTFLKRSFIQGFAFRPVEIGFNKQLPLSHPENLKLLKKDKPVIVTKHSSLGGNDKQFLGVYLGKGRIKLTHELMSDEMYMYGKNEIINLDNIPNTYMEQIAIRSAEPISLSTRKRDKKP